jgi:hypothetical protein
LPSCSQFNQPPASSQDFNATRQPALFSLSCAATGNVALSSNIFTVNSTGFRHITEIVFDKYGVIESA